MSDDIVTCLENAQLNLKASQDHIYPFSHIPLNIVTGQEYDSIEYHRQFVIGQ